LDFIPAARQAHYRNTTKEIAPIHQPSQNRSESGAAHRGAATSVANNLADRTAGTGAIREL
jgi:hypothetical protein